MLMLPKSNFEVRPSQEWTFKLQGQSWEMSTQLHQSKVDLVVYHHGRTFGTQRRRFDHLVTKNATVLRPERAIHCKYILVLSERRGGTTCALATVTYNTLPPRIQVRDDLNTVPPLLKRSINQHAFWIRDSKSIDRNDCDNAATDSFQHMESQSRRFSLRKVLD
ncbi:hypothetical protein F4604DRAFT_1812881 [Suillus subluteus]|nr:hypothetical protein F4604DRAFT_1812881 [Suillus subluteus]